MTLASWTYSSVEEVTALTRHLLDGELAFNDTTRPTLDEVEAFISYASAQINSALADAGFTIPIAQEIVVYEIDAWVTAKAAMYVELTRRGAGYSDGEETRTGVFKSLADSATAYVKANMGGWQELGAAFTPTMSAGLSFTALAAQAHRPDRTNTAREQPLFTRRQFDR